MIILRAIAGVQKHFRVRVSEWAMATATFLWGSILLAPPNTFATSHAYDAMSAIASENIWGAGAAIVGSARLLALLINGTFGATSYGLYSPMIRALAAFANCFIWFTIIVGLLGSHILVLGFAIYPVMFVLDTWNLMQAAMDAGQSNAVRKNDGA